MYLFRGRYILSSLWLVSSWKQRQRLNLYRCFIPVAGDLRRWQFHTRTDHFTFSFQARLFITGNKQGVVRGFEIQGELGERNCRILVLGS